MNQNESKEFDCVEMKNKIQAVINVERKAAGDKWKELDIERLPPDLQEFYNQIKKLDHIKKVSA